jgi:hypothetical protein
MANAEPYQRALRYAIETGGKDESMAVLRQSIGNLAHDLREAGMPTPQICQSLTATARELLHQHQRTTRTTDIAAQIVARVGQWCDDTNWLASVRRTD